MDSDAVKTANRNAFMTLFYGFILLGIFLLPPILIPSSYFMEIDEIELLPMGTRLPGGERLSVDAVKKTRSPRWVLPMHSITTIYQVHTTRSSSQEAVQVLTAVCRGAGDWIYSPRQPSTVILNLDVWLGKPCDLKDGNTYIPYGQWSFEFLLWFWTMDKMGKAVTINE